VAVKRSALPVGQAATTSAVVSAWWPGPDYVAAPMHSELPRSWSTC